MTEFFNTIEEFKDRVGGAADMDEAFLASLAPAIEHARKKHLTPWIGEQTLTTLLTLYPDAVIGSKQADLTAMVQKALSWLGIYEYSFISPIRHNEQGMTSSDKSPFKYQVAENREKCLEIGYENIEALLLFLDANTLTFTDWATSAARRKHKGIFLNTAQSFRDVYSSKITRYTFDLLRGIMEDIEYDCIERTFPARFFADLKTKFKVDANMSTDVERELLYLMQKTVAYFTIEEAMHRHFVQIKDGEIVQASAMHDEAMKNYKPPSRSDMERAAFHIDIWANKHFKRMKNYVLNHVAAFPLAFSPDTAGGTNTDADAWGKAIIPSATNGNQMTERRAAIL